MTTTSSTTSATHLVSSTTHLVQHDGKYFFIKASTQDSLISLRSVLKKIKKIKNETSLKQPLPPIKNKQPEKKRDFKLGENFTLPPISPKKIIVLSAE